MKINRCKECHNYKYLINGKCKDCLYDGIRNSSSSNMINDRYQTNRSNQLTMRQLGSGSEVCTSAEIAREMKSNHNDIRVYIIDPVNHYGGLTKSLGGVTINDPHKNINPLAIPSEVDYIKPQLYNKSVIFSTSFLMNLISKSPMSNMNRIKVVCEALVRRLYELNGVKPSSTNPSNQPKISDLISVVKRAKKNVGELNIQLIRDRSKVISIVSSLERELEKARSDMFDNNQDFELVTSENNNLRCYNPNLSKSPGIMQKEILKNIYLSESNTDVEKLVVINESHLMLKHRQSADLNRIMCDNNSSFNLNIETQSVKDFKNQQKLLTKFDLHRLHRVYLSDEQRQKLGLSQSESDYLSNADVWANNANTVQCLVNSDGKFCRRKITISDRENKIHS